MTVKDLTMNHTSGVRITPALRPGAPLSGVASLHGPPIPNAQMLSRSGRGTCQEPC